MSEMRCWRGDAGNGGGNGIVEGGTRVETEGGGRYELQGARKKPEWPEWLEGWRKCQNGRRSARTWRVVLRTERSGVGCNGIHRYGVEWSGEEKGHKEEVRRR